MNGRNDNRINRMTEWEDRVLSDEDTVLTGKIDEFFRGELDVQEVKSDPGYAETDEAVKLMVADYQNNTHNKESEKFIRENLSDKTPETRMNDEIREIQEEISRNNLDEISSQWVREWHEKRQSNGTKTKEIKEFITSALEEADSNYEQKAVYRKRTGLRRPVIIRYLLMTAAVLTGVIFIVKALIPSDDPVRLFEKYYESLSAVSPVTRNVNGYETNRWTSAISSYNNGDYQAALAVFSGLAAEDTSLVPPRFFLGMTYLALGNSSQAVSLLKGVAEKKGEYSKEAGWYLGLVYLKEGDKVKASENFELLAQSPGYYSERSEKILRRLR